MNEKKLAMDIDLLDKKHNFEDCRYVSVTMSTYREKDIHEKRVFGTPVDLKFENIMIKAPECYDDYLKAIYGDWRKLPPEEKRKTAHDFIDVDLNKPYIGLGLGQSQ